ncbi:hypothetical protein SAMN02745866_04287 [Alteromonadaceae bacterium Bs31]|nr:hypothetical protein SAMN02745866_04287 [Alteromonadaceae bacterium Bs31]
MRIHMNIEGHQKAFLLIFASLLMLVVIVFADSPVFVGTEMGKVVSYSTQSKNHRDFQVAYLANVKLESGKTVYINMVSVTSGQLVEVAIYKRRFTGFKSYVERVRR